jgi:hypothetical protein
VEEEGLYWQSGSCGMFSILTLPALFLLCPLKRVIVCLSMCPILFSD